MRKLMTLLALGAGYMLAGCGGGDALPRMPDKQGHIMLWADAADTEDYEELAQLRYAFVAEPHALILATNDPSEANARLVLFEHLQTWAFVVRVLR